jgi:hypothetical protein
VSPTPLDRLALYFTRSRTRQGILARAALRMPDAGDGALAAELAAPMAAELRPDGSVGGAAVPTIWRAHELLDLGRPPDDPAVRAILGWLLQRQDGPGAYGEGCDRARHAQRICEHWVRGFFAPAPPAQRIAPVTLPNGKVFRAEPAARFAVSCLGLRAALRAGLGDQPDILRHLDSVRALAQQWSDWKGFFSPDMIVAGLHALALAGPAYRQPVEALVSLMTSHQRLDGLWPEADPFAALEALQATGTPAARTLARRAVPTLMDRQREDGTFGPLAREERALIAVRALLWVTR